MNGYVVVHGNNIRFFSRFVNGLPKFTSRPEYAMTFDYEEMAQHVAQRCEARTGHKYKVVNLNDED